MRLKRSFIASTIAITLVFAGMGTASADSAGGLAGWSAVGDGSAEIQKAERGARSMSYSYDEPSWEVGQWTMAKTAESSGPLGLDWAIEGNHGFFLDYVKITVFADGPGGVTTQVLLATLAVPDEGPDSTDGPFAFSGTAQIEITAGYNFGFIVDGGNYDCCSMLQGTLTVKERS